MGKVLQKSINIPYNQSLNRTCGRTYQLLKCRQNGKVETETIGYRKNAYTLYNPSFKTITSGSKPLLVPYALEFGSAGTACNRLPHLNEALLRRNVGAHYYRF